MLPGQDGFDICRQIRQTAKLERTPVIFLTARSDEVDRVLGLEIGGDDYMTKPFSPRELVARDQGASCAVGLTETRRRRRPVSAWGRSASIGARAEFISDRAARGDKEIELTSTEFKLLEFFLTHPGTAWSREQLLREVWGEQHFVTPRTVDVHIRRLREQIEDKPDEPVYLVTVRGSELSFSEAPLIVVHNFTYRFTAR